MIQWPKTNDVLGCENRGDPCESGLCTLCIAECSGNCETWLSSIKGRKMLYPRNCGLVTAGSNNTVAVGSAYNSLRIKGYNCGAIGLRKDLNNKTDNCLFTNVNLESSFGHKKKTKVSLPILTGALGSTLIAAKYWESFAVGAALVGFPIVIGENVVGVDKHSQLKPGKIVKAPELDKRINSFFKYYNGYGAVIIQMNIEDQQNGLAEYLIEKYGNKVIIEIKWGQGAKNLGGEIQVNDLESALFLQKRGYLVDPDPSLAETQEAFKHRAIKSFARHGKLGYTKISSWQKIQKSFMDTVVHLRKLGFERITLKTGAYGLETLAMAIKFASDAELDLLTIDGAGGGTGMSPWNMMQNWGLPSIFLHSKAYEYASLLSKKGKTVVDMAFAGGFAREDHIFKALALGAPYTKLVSLGRALMIPGYLGSNIEGVLNPNSRESVHGNWDKLPKNIAERGSSAEEIFASYHDVQKKVGKNEMKNIPLGAVAIWTLADKLSAGVQQLMAGARKFSLDQITRNEIFSGNRETEAVTKIPFLTDVGDQSAKAILNS